MVLLRALSPPSATHTPRPHIMAPTLLRATTLLLAASLATATGARPPWAPPVTVTATAAAGDGRTVAAAVCDGVSAAAVTETAEDGTLLTASCREKRKEEREVG